ncbi:cation:proton antiporter [Niabella terrae]
MVLLATSDFSLPLTNPVIIFALVLFIILFAPILFAKIKVPHIIGLIIAGVLVGPHATNLLQRDMSIVLFGTVGLLYIMFLAGLEIDLAEFKKNKSKILAFGLITFLIPLTLGFLAGYHVLGFNLMPSLLLGGMFSTHTLVSYPIASKYGITHNSVVAIAVGGTMITDTAALLLLAAVSGMTQSQVSDSFWLQLGISSIIFVCIVFFVFPIIIRWFFKQFDDSVSQYIFVLGMVFLASFLAEVAGLEPIIGAFFSGLVLNKFIPHSSGLSTRINFVGNAIFIPFFLIGVGMLVDLKVLFKSWEAARVAGVIILVAISGKLVSAWLTAKIFKFNVWERGLLHGLSSSHAAATLAIVLVGYNIIIGETPVGDPIRLLNEDVLNGTVLLILVSCGISSFITERASKSLALIQEERDASTTQFKPGEKVLISVAYPAIANDLMDLAVMLKTGKSDLPMYVLHIVEDESEATNAAGKGRKILDNAIKYAADSENIVTPLLRYDSSISNGIIYTIKEQQITDVVIGLHQGADEKVFFGEITENIIRRTFETIYVYRPAQPFNTLKRMIVLVPPHGETDPGFTHWVQKLESIGKISGMKLKFYGTDATLQAIKTVLQYIQNPTEAIYTSFYNWDDFLVFTREINANDLFVIVSSRKDHNSYISQLNKLPYYLSNYFKKVSFMLLYPKQLDTGINMEDIQQADGKLIETISEQFGAINKAGKKLRKRIWRK